MGCSIGRFDKQTATMTPGSPQANVWRPIEAPRAAIRVRIDIPDLGGIPNKEFDWCHSVYRYVEEVLPKDLPKPPGNSVTTLAYKDANLCHNMIWSICQ
jgi:hypothetical protein